MMMMMMMMMSLVICSGIKVDNTSADKKPMHMKTSLQPICSFHRSVNVVYGAIVCANRKLLIARGRLMA